MARNHQPDQGTFRAILPEDIEWKSFPAFPPGARLAVDGRPSCGARALRGSRQGTR